jgi:hypothetical protein
MPVFNESQFEQSVNAVLYQGGKACMQQFYFQKSHKIIKFQK